MGNTVRTWRNQFGEKFSPPAPIAALLQEDGVRDLSWGNDVCPRFGAQVHDAPVWLYIWFDSADEEARECEGGSRFVVCMECADDYHSAEKGGDGFLPTQLYAGESAEDAALVFRTALQTAKYFN